MDNQTPNSMITLPFTGNVEKDSEARQKLGEAYGFYASANVFRSAVAEIAESEAALAEETATLVAEAVDHERGEDAPDELALDERLEVAVETLIVTDEAIEDRKTTASAELRRVIVQYTSREDCEKAMRKAEENHILRTYPPSAIEYSKNGNMKGIKKLIRPSYWTTKSLILNAFFEDQIPLTDPATGEPLSMDKLKELRKAKRAPASKATPEDLVRQDVAKLIKHLNQCEDPKATLFDATEVLFKYADDLDVHFSQIDE